MSTENTTKTIPFTDSVRDYGLKYASEHNDLYRLIFIQHTNKRFDNCGNTRITFTVLAETTIHNNHYITNVSVEVAQLLNLRVSRLTNHISSNESMRSIEYALEAKIGSNFSVTYIDW